MELKNHWTGQNAKVHGINQYKFKRDNTQPLLNFGRCIVHFAVDTDEAYMTTKLDGGNTFFLPFNLGNNNTIKLMEDLVMKIYLFFYFSVHLHTRLIVIFF